MSVKTQQPEKVTGTYVDTIAFNAETAKKWAVPGFQRAVTVNRKITELAEHLKENDGVLPGIICFGILDRTHYLIDGQQRREAFLLSGCKTGYADARFCHFDSIAEMATEFVSLNTHLVSMKPDDILRGLEPSLKCLQLLRKKCPFVGYDMIRRSEANPIVSMSAMLRAWKYSAAEVPGGGGASSAMLAQGMSEDDADNLADFLNLCMKAWGRDQVYSRLWNLLNLSLCAWLYRRLVLSTYSARSVRLTKDSFCKCLMSLSANELYVDWLQGRKFGDRDRAPCYARIKALFVRRMEAETGKKSVLPAPAWAVGK